MKDLSDWELVQLYMRTCKSFINPKIFNEMKSRNLLHIVNLLPKEDDVAEAVVIARMTKAGKMPPGIDEDKFSIMQRIDNVKSELTNTPATEKHVLLEKIEILKKLIERL